MSAQGGESPDASARLCRQLWKVSETIHFPKNPKRRKERKSCNAQTIIAFALHHIMSLVIRDSFIRNVHQKPLPNQGIPHTQHNGSGSSLNNQMVLSCRKKMKGENRKRKHERGKSSTSFARGFMNPSRPVNQMYVTPPAIRLTPCTISPAEKRRTRSQTLAQFTITDNPTSHLSVVMMTNKNRKSNPKSL